MNYRTLDEMIAEIVGRVFDREITPLRRELIAVRQLLEQRNDRLLPLWEIIGGISKNAARMRIERDKELKKLGVKIGQRYFFRRRVVEEYYARRGDVEAASEIGSSVGVAK